MTARFSVTADYLKYLGKPGRKTIDQTSLDSFWDEVGSGNRRGVYVFGVKAAKGWKPLYVGQTKAKNQSFQTRIYQHVNGGTFNQYLRGIKRGKPYLFLLGRVGKGKISTTAINELEIELINLCFKKNPKLHNRRGIKKATYVVDGFGHGGGKRPEVQSLKRMIGW